MKQIYSIREYGSFLSGREVPGFVSLPPKVFEQLEELLLRSPDGELSDFLTLSFRRGIGKVLQVRNYAGILDLDDHTAIEILPKAVFPQGDPGGVLAKKLLLEMLRTLPDAPFRKFQTAELDLATMDLFEIFIRMFLDETAELARRGLKCSYVPTEENVRFFRGKLLLSQHLIQNNIHQERSYVCYDDFNADRPENRLLKSTLLRLSGQSRSFRNRNDIRQLLRFFETVHPSTNYAADFSRCVSDRNTRAYDTALGWCRAFLSGKSFTAYSGSSNAAALLFPMETLFESYIATLLKKILPAGCFSLSVQDSQFWLFDEPRAFRLRPDLVLTRKSDGAVFVLDTKWKLLSGSGSQPGISQADLYQMFVYQKKYAAQSVTLLYPQSETLSSEKELHFSAADGTRINACFLDLSATEKSLRRIVDSL